MLRTIQLALLTFMTVALLIPPSAPVHARAGDWKLVGSDAISLREEDATIQVGRSEGALSDIQLRVWGKSFYLRTITVVFGNGQRQVISVYDRIAAGSGTRAFPLQGGRRYVRDIRLRYRDAGSRGFRRSLVEVYGKEAGRPRPRPTPPGRWSKIGEEDFSTRDRRVTIGVNGGGKRILIGIRGADVYVRNAIITFGNGDRQRVEIEEIIDRGTRFGPIDLDGNYRFIRSVRLNLQRRSRRRDVTAEIFAQGERPRPAPRPVPRGWKRLNAVDVDLRDDRFVIPVGRDKGLLKSIRIRSMDNPVYIRRVSIEFGNGDIQRVRIGERISAGGETGTIDLDGRVRFVKRITVRTRDQSRRRRTRLVAIGEVGRRVVPPLPPVPRGWKVVDAQTVDLRDDRFVMPVGRGEGRFSEIRLRNRGNPVYIRSMRIVFGNGDVQNVRLDQRLPVAGRTRIIDLDGRTRFIRHVIVRTDAQRRRAETRFSLVGHVGRAAPPPPPPPSSGSGDWQTIGSARFKLRSRSFSIPVGPGKGKFSAIRFIARLNAVPVRRIVIVYGNGDQHDVTMNTLVHGAGYTAPIDLSGSGRRISHIVVVIKRKRFSSRRAELVVQGLPARTGRWISLGQRRADMFQPTRDTFIVGRRRGRFRKIKIRALRHHIRYYSIIVTFGNGERFRLPFAGRLVDGTETPAYDLPARRGRGRFIEAIEVVHKSKINFRGEGATEVLLHN